MPELESLVRYSISEFRKGDRSYLQHILSDPALLESLYPQAIRPPDTSKVVTEWATGPIGTGDLQLVARSPEGALCGCLRLEKNELSYFVDPVHWGKGCGRFMLRWVKRRILATRTGDSFRAIVAQNNRVSIHLLESTGFVFSGMAGEYSCRTLLEYTLRT